MVAGLVGLWGRTRPRIAVALLATPTKQARFLGRLSYRDCPLIGYFVSVYTSQNITMSLESVPRTDSLLVLFAHKLTKHRPELRART